MRAENHFVFGYGSLFDIESLKKFLNRNVNTKGWQLCNLNGFRRKWNIAMDNSLNLKDYKYYIDVRAGTRPNIYVTFLNIYECINACMNGILFLVSSNELKMIDKRERNYKRININGKLDVDLPFPCWAYIGIKDAKLQYNKGIKTSNSFIDINYYDFIKNAFSKHGKEFLDCYLQTTDVPEVPFKDLKLIKT